MNKFASQHIVRLSRRLTLILIHMADCDPMDLCALSSEVMRISALIEMTVTLQA